MSTQFPNKDILTIEEVASLLGYQNARSLRNRLNRKLVAPPYIKIPGTRTVMFMREDVIAFLRQNRVGTVLPDR